MNAEIECFNCRFFSREDTGRPTDAHEVIPEGQSVSAEGECRRKPPRHGNTIIRKDRSEFICFGDWPKVLADDWCGEFEPIANI